MLGVTYVKTCQVMMKLPSPTHFWTCQCEAKFAVREENVCRTCCLPPCPQCKGCACINPIRKSLSRFVKVNEIIGWEAAANLTLLGDLRYIGDNLFEFRDKTGWIVLMVVHPEVAVLREVLEEPQRVVLRNVHLRQTFEGVRELVSQHNTTITKVKERTQSLLPQLLRTTT